MLGPIGDDHLLRRHGQAPGFLIKPRDGRPQFDNAGGRRVVGVPIEHGLVRGLADVFRCGKSGSPRLKSYTRTPSVRSCRALAPAARVADGWTAAAMREMVRFIAAS